MGASKPLAYCQDLQVAAGRAKPSGCSETCAPSSRNETELAKRTHPWEPRHTPGGSLRG